MRKLFVVMIVLFYAIPVFAMGSVPSSMMPANALVGKPAPEFTLSRLKSGQSNFTDVREGKRAIIVFWATWCPHCHDVLEMIHQMSAKLEQEGIKVLLVNAGESKEEVAAYFARKQYDFDSFIDEENVLQQAYQLQGVPTVVFINSEGLITNSLHEFPANYDAYFQ